MITKDDVLAAFKEAYAAHPNDKEVLLALQPELFKDETPSEKTKNVADVLAYLKSLPSNAKTANMSELNTNLAFMNQNRSSLNAGDLGDLIAILHAVENDKQVPDAIRKRLGEFKRLQLSSYDDDDPAEVQLTDAIAALAAAGKDPKAALAAIATIQSLEYLLAPTSKGAIETAIVG